VCDSDEEEDGEEEEGEGEGGVRAPSGTTISNRKILGTYGTNSKSV